MIVVSMRLVRTAASHQCLPVVDGRCRRCALRPFELDPRRAGQATRLRVFLNQVPHRDAPNC